jgi:hypothetical protein
VSGRLDCLSSRHPEQNVKLCFSFKADGALCSRPICNAGEHPSDRNPSNCQPVLPSIDELQGIYDPSATVQSQSLAVKRRFAPVHIRAVVPHRPHQTRGRVRPRGRGLAFSGLGFGFVVVSCAASGRQQAASRHSRNESSFATVVLYRNFFLTLKTPSLCAVIRPTPPPTAS